jgi:hypothetical protein
MLCQCGCGGLTNIIKVNKPEYGRIKGEYSRYILGHRVRLPQRRPGNWKRIDDNIMSVSKEFGSIRLAVMLADRILKRRHQLERGLK